MINLLLQNHVCPICKNSLSIANEDDISLEKISIEEKALILMVKLLDNIEEFKELSANLQIIMEDARAETSLMQLFNVLIDGIELEYKQLGQ